MKLYFIMIKNNENNVKMKNVIKKIQIVLIQNQKKCIMK